MYSWIASWFTDEESQLDEALYATNGNASQKSGDWTWIEVIKENDTNGLIYIQSSEEEKHEKIASCESPKEHRLQRRRKRREIMAERAFENSLYLDYSLFVEPPKLKFMKRCVPLPATLQALHRKTMSVSEILSNSFPQNELAFTPRQNAYDLADILYQAVVMKNILQMIMKSERTSLECGLEQWLDGMMNRRNLRSIEWKEKKAIGWKKPPLCIEWKKTPLSIEWKKTPLSIEWKKEESTCCGELKVAKVKRYIPNWLKRIEVVEEYKKFPGWMRKIDPTLFTNGSLIEEDVPLWMQLMEMVEEEEHASDQKIPSWMQQIDLFDEIHRVPSWMQNIDVIEDGTDCKTHTPSEDVNCEDLIQMDIAMWMKRMNIFGYETSDIFQKYQWMELMETPMDIEKITTKPKLWLQRISELTDKDYRPALTSMCGIMVNLTVFLTVNEMCSATSRLETSAVTTKSYKTVSIGSKRKRCATMQNLSLKKKREIKKNKNWVRRHNATRKTISNKQKRNPRNFSRMGGFRAC